MTNIAPLDAVSLGGYELTPEGIDNMMKDMRAEEMRIKADEGLVGVANAIDRAILR